MYPITSGSQINWRGDRAAADPVFEAQNPIGAHSTFYVIKIRKTELRYNT